MQHVRFYIIYIFSDSQIFDFYTNAYPENFCHLCFILISLSSSKINVLDFYESYTVLRSAAMVCNKFMIP